MHKELVHVYRGDFVESIHYGSAAVVDLNGEVMNSVGDPEFKTYIRSSAKPIQVLPVILSGAAEKYGFTPKELAVMCASHSGEDFHTDTVRGILKKIAVEEDSLACGVHKPYHKKTAKALFEAGLEPGKIHCNCSGKHSSMLSLCAHHGWDLNDYVEIDHPVQQLMIDVMSEVCDIPRDDFWLGIDGCGVPVFGLPLKNMALGFARLSKPDAFSSKYDAPIRTITAAMNAHPEQVAGTDRFCTDLMRTMGGKVVAKGGAQAVYCVGFLDKGIGLAVKIADGNSRGRAAVVLKIMEDMGLINEDELNKLDKYRYPKVKNHRKQIVGELKTVFELD